MSAGIQALEDAANAFYFLHNNQPREGTDYSENAKFASGRTAGCMFVM